MREATRFAGEERRLHPATLALALPKMLRASVNMLPAFAALGITGNWQWVAPAILVFIILWLGATLIGWLRFGWRVDADDIVISSGVVSRNQLTIPFDRIQDVNIEQGMIARALGLAKVTLETGSVGAEAELDAIALEDAAALRDHIRAHRAVATPVAATLDGTTPDPATASVLLSMSPGRLFIAGLFNFSLAIIAVLFGVLQTFDDVLPFDPFEPQVWIDFANRFGLEQWVMAHQWLTAIGGLIALLLLGMLTGVARMVLTNWDFRLERTERGFRRTRGLTTRTDVVIPAARVQGAVIASGLIGRRFGWHSLALQSLASDGKDEADHVVAPFATLAEIDAILAELGLERAGLEEAPHRRDDIWQRVHPVAATGWLLMAGIALAVAVAALMGLADQIAGGGRFAASNVAMVPLGLCFLFLLLGWLDWRAHRWTYDGRLLHIVSGALTRRHHVLPARNVQSADVSIGPVTRRAGAGALILGVPGGKSGEHAIPAMALPLARVLRAQLLAAR